MGEFTLTYSSINKRFRELQYSVISNNFFLLVRNEVWVTFTIRKTISSIILSHSDGPYNLTMNIVWSSQWQIIILMNILCLEV